ncbi:MAG: hypothetical protein QXI12_06705, partial [Candidatus Methanomethyliaceae archaeon]
EEIQYMQYTIFYVPRKFVKVSWQDIINGKEVTRTRYFQDVFGFFQCSFEKALVNWKIEVPDFLSEYKRKRSGFSIDDIDNIKRYNRLELDLLVQLMRKLKQADLDAFTRAGLRPGQKNSCWYGPGARAAHFLAETQFLDDHPEFAGGDYPKLQKEVTDKRYPFIEAFYGGRIETAGLGLFEWDRINPYMQTGLTLFNADINSAYPYAISLLPKWREDCIVQVNEYDSRDRMGMYLVEWMGAPTNRFGPFPFRAPNGNVYFPLQGMGWYMSPEVHAAKTCYPGMIRILGGFVLDDTDGGGSGLNRLPEKRLCQTAKTISDMAKMRLELKKKGDLSNIAIKLVLNSCYGKTIQHVGSHRYLHDFVASWITSVCRAMILRAICQNMDSIITIATDSLLSTMKLALDYGVDLGQWECEEYHQLIQFLPGIYRLHNAGTGKTKLKFRGISKDFDPDFAKRYLYNNEGYQIPLKIFVTRRLALNQYKSYGDKAYRFVEIIRTENFSLESKRSDDQGFKLIAGQENKIFPPKMKPDMLLVSKGFDLKLRDSADVAYDQIKEGECLESDPKFLKSLLEENEINS